MRALTLNVALPSTGPIVFDPCDGCDKPCHQACPQGVFDRRIYKMEDYDLECLPGRNGEFSRPACISQMEMDNDAAQEQEVGGFDQPLEVIKYCRRCELTCPVGQ
jgi:epoxyqueuosine reductase